MIELQLLAAAGIFLCARKTGETEARSIALPEPRQRQQLRQFRISADAHAFPSRRGVSCSGAPIDAARQHRFCLEEKGWEGRARCAMMPFGCQKIRTKRDCVRQSMPTAI